MRAAVDGRARSRQPAQAPSAPLSTPSPLKAKLAKLGIRRQYRSGAASAAAVRGRNPAHAHRRSAGRRAGAGRGHGDRQPDRLPPAAPAGVQDRGRQRTFVYALPQFLRQSGEGAGRGRARARLRRSAPGIFRRGDGAPALSHRARGHATARGADADISDYRRAAAGGLAPPDRAGPGAMRTRRNPARGNPGAVAHARVSRRHRGSAPAAARRRRARAHRAHPSRVAAHEVGRIAGAAAVDAPALPRAQAQDRACARAGRRADRGPARAPAVPADARAKPRLGRNRTRSGRGASDAPPAAGRCRQRQDRGGGAGGAARGGKRLCRRR